MCLSFLSGDNKPNGESEGYESIVPDINGDGTSDLFDLYMVTEMTKPDSEKDSSDR